MQASSDPAVTRLHVRHPLIQRDAASVTQRRLPSYIVALTADVTAENRERCLTVGMNELAGKPDSQSRLRELMQRT